MSYNLVDSERQYLSNCLVCLRQNDFTLPKASSRDTGSTAKVIRSQFFSPTAVPAKVTSFLIINGCLSLKTGKIKWLVHQVFYDFVYEFVICSSVNAMMYIMTLTSTWKQVTTSFWQGYWFLNHKNCKLLLIKERFGERLSTQIIAI